MLVCDDARRVAFYQSLNRDHKFIEEQLHGIVERFVEIVRTKEFGCLRSVQPELTCVVITCSVSDIPTTKDRKSQHRGRCL